MRKSICVRSVGFESIKFRHYVAINSIVIDSQIIHLPMESGVSGICFLRPPDPQRIGRRNRIRCSNRSTGKQRTVQIKFNVAKISIYHGYGMIPLVHLPGIGITVSSLLPRIIRSYRMEVFRATANPEGIVPVTGIRITRPFVEKWSPGIGKRSQSHPYRDGNFPTRIK